MDATITISREASAKFRKVFESKLEDYDAMIFHTLHDEIIVGVEGGIVEEVKVTMENCMIEAFSKLEIPFKVKTNIQESWNKK